MSFLQLENKSILIFGVANRKSVAWHIGRVLVEAGARCVYVVQNEELKAGVSKLVGGGEIYVCDVEHEDQIARLRDELAGRGEKFHGLVHSIAFADYSARPKTVPRDAEKGLFAGHGYFLLFAHRRFATP